MIDSKGLVIASRGVPGDNCLQEAGVTARAAIH